MRYVGLDVHYRTSTYCILDENGHEVACETIRGHWPKLLERLAQIAGPWSICFEATCGYGYLYRELSTLGARVIVAHPGQLRLIFRAKRKNDRIDARKLAKGCIARRRSGRTSSGCATAARSGGRSRWWRRPTTSSAVCMRCSSAAGPGRRRRERLASDAAMPCVLHEVAAAGMSRSVECGSEKDKGTSEGKTRD